MNRRNRLWTYVAILAVGTLLAVVMPLLIDLLAGNLSIVLAAGMLMLAILISGVLLYYRVRKTDR